MNEEAIVVFTGESVEEILQKGGTSSWRLHPTHARNCPFVVCTRNTKSKWEENNSRVSEPAKSAFLIGKVMDVVLTPLFPNRYLIRFSEFARINVPDAWKGFQNPIKYMTMENVGFDPSILQWEPMPEIRPQIAQTPSSKTEKLSIASGAHLTITEAKAGLARTFGVSPEQIEIIIKG